MPTVKTKVVSPVDSKRRSNLVGADQLRKVIVCAETSSSTSKVINHAIAISNAIGAEIHLVHVIDPLESPYIPFDPFEWDLRCREAEAFVNQLAQQYESTKYKIRTSVLQGNSSDQICSCVANSFNDIAVLCRSDTECSGHIGQTTRRVLEMASSSVLLIPASSVENVAINYRRILVPLDGSASAENTLQLARKIACEQRAELLLVHAIPEPIFTGIGPLSDEDLELKDHILRRNERVAREYLGRLSDNIKPNGITVSTRILMGGDPRRLLKDLIMTEAVDLVVLSSHGQSGNTDVFTGDVTSHLLAYSAAPVLMIRRPRDKGSDQSSRGAASVGARRPTGDI